MHVYSVIGCKNEYSVRSRVVCYGSDKLVRNVCVFVGIVCIHVIRLLCVRCHVCIKHSERQATTIRQVYFLAVHLDLRIYA